MTRYSVWATPVVAMTVCAASAMMGGETRADAGPALTLLQARALARTQHPTLARLRAQITASSARVDQLDAVLMPTVGGTASAIYGVVTPPAAVDAPNAVVQVGVAANWTFLDFGKNSSQIEAGRAGVAADEVAIAASERDLDQAVVEAFLTALAQRDLVAVAETTLAAETRHREEAERFVQAGVRAPLDAAQAKTREAQAKTMVVRARAQAELALVNLGRAMGVTTPPAAIAGDLASVAVEATGRDALVAQALGQRDEVRAFEARLRALELSVTAADRGLRPTLGASAQGGVGSVGLEEWKPTWQVGVSLNVPFYDGGRTRAATAAARADLAAARSGLEELHVRVAAEVDLALTALTAAQAEVEAAESARSLAEVQLSLAEARWKQGLGTGIDLADAQTGVALTAAARTQAELSLAVARARLVRALGAP